MKKTLSRIFILIMALLTIMPSAFAKEYKIYGDGSKKVYEIKDRYGKTWRYYDIYDGAKEREDASDASRFIRRALSTSGKWPEGNKREPLTWEWDYYGRTYFADANDLNLKLDGHNVTTEIAELRRYFQREGGILIESNGMENTEKAIRENLARISRDEFGDKKIQPNHFKEIAGLKDLKPAEGVTFTTMNVYGRLHKRVMAIGSIFYDFNFGYLEDGKIADSGVGAETDPDKVKGNRGVKIDDSGFKQERESWIENNTLETIERDASFSESHETSLENSVSTSKDFTKDLKIGVEVTVKNKLPFVAESDVSISSEVTMSWASSTTNGKSESISESQTYSDSASATVPPRSKARVQLMRATGSYSIEYDYPIVITYKIAQYIILDNTRSTIFAVWGDSENAANSYAHQNLYNRYEHRNELGYERTYSSGYPIKWDKVKMEWGLENHLMKGIPMSLTGGTIGVTGSRFKIIVHEPTPIDPIGKLKINGPSEAVMTPASKLDLTASVPIAAIQDYSDADVPFYGFVAQRDGYWYLCDKDGKQAQSDFASLNEENGHFVVTAKDMDGELYAKYALREKATYQIARGEGENVKLIEKNFENKGVKNETLLRISVESNPVLFGGRVEIAGDVEAVLGQPLDLTHDGPAVKCVYPEGAPAAIRFPPIWSVVGGDTDGISVKNNMLLVYKEGDYELVATVEGIESNKVKVKIIPGTSVSGIELDQHAITLSKGDSYKLTASVFPQNAANTDVIWKSMNNKVATVDNDGKVMAHKTGMTAITATTADGGFKDSCDVAVEIAAENEALDIGNLALVKNKSYKLGTPGYSQGRWTSDNLNIAEVDEKGKVTAKNFGETTLTFLVTNAKEKAAFMGKSVSVGDMITVPLAVRAKGEVVSKITLPEKKITLAPQGMYILRPALKPSSAPEQQVYYKTGDKSVALVDDYGVITGVSNGKTAVTATSASGKSAKINVTVTDKLNKITLNVKKVKLVAGETFRLVATPVPADLAGFSPVFITGDPTVATVDEDGTVMGIDSGKTTITAQAGPGSNVKTKCEVKVH